ncbi:MAG: carbonic anhydrase family protein [Betaproteobacteria bacterium]|nr:carbonic anhydrase family protein [Betaproteobacteria bacterium]
MIAEARSNADIHRNISDGGDAFLSFSRHPRRGRDFALCLCLLALAGTSPAIEAKTAKNQAIETEDWTYTDQANWPARYCSAGYSHQSPISFAGLDPTPRGEIVDVKVSNGVEAYSFIKNYTAEFRITDSVAQKISVGSGNNRLNYKLTEFHFHFPVEHILPGGASFELHVKTKADNGTSAVFAVLFQTSDSAPGYDAIRQATALTRNIGASGKISLYSLLRYFTAQPFYAYPGSLTTPACDGGVQWYVLRTAVPIDAQQARAFQAALTSQRVGAPNARTPPQPVEPMSVEIVTPQAGSKGRAVKK